MRENLRESSLLSQKEGQMDQEELVKRILFDQNLRLQESLSSFSSGLKEIEESYDKYEKEQEQESDSRYLTFLRYEFYSVTVSIFCLYFSCLFIYFFKNFLYTGAKA